MNKKLKILILGIGQSNFLNQLYSEILNRSDTFEFSINGYFDLSKGVVKNKDLPYVEFLNLENYYPSKLKQLKYGFYFFNKRFFWRIAFFELSQKLSLSNLKKKLQVHIIAKYLAEEVINNLNIQAVHYHFGIPENLILGNYIKEEIPSIVSFWGSDLMRVTGEENVFYVRRALQNCSAITLQTPEMAEMFYCKYGREFSQKMHILRFNLNADIFKQIDAFKNHETEIKKNKERLLPNSKSFIIAIGHNAFPENNHFKIIAAIKSLPPEVRSNVSLVMHLSYGGNQNYIESLKDLVEKEESLDIRVITEFLAPRDMALFRVLTNLMIQMPASDALSSAMTEVLYAGNTVVAGGWLPYGLLRRKGVHFLESESFRELPQLINDAYFEYEYYLDKNRNNSLIIRNFLFPDKTSPKWIDLFQSVFVEKIV